MQILLPEAYLSFPHLGKPSKYDEDSDLRFNFTLIFPKGTDLTELKKVIEEVREEKLGTKQPKNPPLKDCSTQIDEDTGFVKALHDKGDVFITPWSSEDKPPILVGPDNKPGYYAANFKGGNIVQAIVNVWGSAYKANPSIGFSIMAVQWRAEGEPIGAKANLNLFSAAEPGKMDAASLGI